jgi:ribosomal protein S18 acetylase RimI-like enzyme
MSQNEVRNGTMIITLNRNSAGLENFFLGEVVMKSNYSSIGLIRSNKLLGILVYKQIRDNDVKIYGIEVLQEFRRQGIGSSLIEYFMKNIYNLKSWNFIHIVIENDIHRTFIKKLIERKLLYNVLLIDEKVDI